MPRHNKDGLLQIPKGTQIRKLGNPTTQDGDHHRTYQSLFSHAPSFADAVQGSLGDCYLIAALSSILNCPGGPEAIEECFLDKGSGGLSGEVVVRLYDVNCTAQYVSMEKSVVSGVGAKSTIWVKLFEKAYSALFTGGTYESLATVAGGLHGMGSDVLRAVLGSRAETLGCSENDNIFEKLVTMAPNSGANRKREVREAVFADDEILFNQWCVFMREKFPGWRNIISTSTCFRMEDWEAFLLAHGQGLNMQVLAAVQEWIDRTSPLPGRRGTGRYSGEQRRIFQAVKTALEQNKPVSTGTHQSVAKKSKTMQTTGNSGESMAQSGLVGGHAYSIIGAKEEEHLYWVKLANPWKRGGVQYEKGTHTEGRKLGRAYLRPRYDPGAGDFWLEMCDLTKHFKGVYVGGNAVV